MEDGGTVGDMLLCTGVNKASPSVPLIVQDLKLRVQHKLGEITHIDCYKNKREVLVGEFSYYYIFSYG